MCRICNSNMTKGDMCSVYCNFSITDGLFAPDPGLCPGLCPSRPQAT